MKKYVVTVEFVVEANSPMGAECIVGASTALDCVEAGHGILDASICHGRTVEPHPRDPRVLLEEEEEDDVD